MNLRNFPTYSEIRAGLEEYDKFSDIALDWLIISWDLKDEDKVIAISYYRKACKEKAKVAKRLSELTKGWRIK